MADKTERELIKQIIAERDAALAAKNEAEAQLKAAKDAILYHRKDALNAMKGWHDALDALHKEQGKVKQAETSLVCPAADNNKICKLTISCEDCGKARHMTDAAAEKTRGDHWKAEFDRVVAERNGAEARLAEVEKGSDSDEPLFRPYST